MKIFSDLFKKYRLRAEFETFASFSNALAEKGYFYEESIFSHWQKGTRTPGNRQLLLKIIEIFVEKHSIISVKEANEFLSSAKLGYLTDTEVEGLHLVGTAQSPFQVPKEIAHFTGRENLIEDILQEVKNGKVVHLYGSAGIGKTTLAIKLAHLLRDDFPDGILWYRMDNTSIKEVILSTAHTFGQTLPSQSNIEIMASFMRSLLSQKKVLLLLDNVEENSNVHLFLPNSLSSNLIILSKQKNLYIPADSVSIHLTSFTERESFSLFDSILGKEYVKKYHSELSKLCQIIGNLPLAAHLFAHQLYKSNILPADLHNIIQKEEISLKNLSYESKNLYIAINISYKNLSQKAKAVFLSIGVFEGKDFSLEALIYINGLSKEKAQVIVDELINKSLVERSINGKFRIHPIIKKFIGEKLNNPYLSLLNKISIVAFLFYTVYWIVIQMNTSLGMYDRLFSSTYFTVALWGAVLGVAISKKWGGTKSTMGKAILFFSLGLFFQVFGQVAYAYYALFQMIEIPYPSIGDIGYFGTIPIYILGVFFLAKVSGIKLNITLMKKHLIAFYSSMTLLFAGILLLLLNYHFDWSYPLKIFLDFIYPVGDMVYVYLALLLYLELRKSKHNIMKNKVIIFVIALFCLFLADFVFVYQANLQIWQGGNINDLMYLIVYLIMTLAILQLNSHLNRVFIK